MQFPLIHVVIIYLMLIELIRDILKRWEKNFTIFFFVNLIYVLHSILMVICATLEPQEGRYIWRVTPVCHISVNWSPKREHIFPTTWKSERERAKKKQHYHTNDLIAKVSLFYYIILLYVDYCHWITAQVSLDKKKKNKKKHLPK